MASAKIATLVIRTLAKPISNQIKQQAKQHETFRSFCVGLAQRMHRTEVRLRTNILGEPAKHIRPLSETRAIESGANALAEGFLFAVAAGLIIGETWRSSRNQSKRRDDVDDKLEDLDTRVTELTTRFNSLASQIEERLDEERRRNDELSRILERMVEIGLRGGWAEFEDTPLRIPRISLSRSHREVDQETQEERDNSIETSDGDSSRPSPSS
ncbi:optic atrophy 3 family [Moniliophthora roreri MCA 2997]|uniref:Optic atrophy 3 family n=1 Tax=Moniliophthora roreri (strain MCA 2997) TaxID=1381753 RepID=V2XEY5_MONRO|nr:optic atrophy 3 family [Moniliophthora roreri MCA 2997]